MISRETVIAYANDAKKCNARYLLLVFDNYGEVIAIYGNNTDEKLENSYDVIDIIDLRKDIEAQAQKYLSRAEIQEKNHAHHEHN